MTVVTRFWIPCDFFSSNSDRNWQFAGFLLGSAFLSSVEQKLGGVSLLRVEGGEDTKGRFQTKNKNKNLDTILALCANTVFCFTVDCTVDLVWGHTTHSMCIGYMAQQDKKPKVKYESSLILPTLCLRSPSNSNLLCIEGAVVSLTESATRSAVSGGHGL